MGVKKEIIESVEGPAINNLWLKGDTIHIYKGDKWVPINTSPKQTKEVTENIYDRYKKEGGTKSEGEFFSALFSLIEYDYV